MVVVVVVVVTLGGMPVAVVVVTFGHLMRGLKYFCCPEPSVLLTVSTYATISCAKLTISCLLMTGSSLFCANV